MKIGQCTGSFEFAIFARLVWYGKRLNAGASCRYGKFYQQCCWQPRTFLIDSTITMPFEETRKPLKTEPILAGLALLLLLVGCFFILRPFFSAILWAIILTYSLHPLQKKFTHWFRGSRTLAACLVTLTLLVIIAGPVVLIGISLAKDSKELAIATKNWFMSVPESPPAWMNKTPIVGDELAGYWTNFAEKRNRWMDQLDKAVEAPPKAMAVEEKFANTEDIKPAELNIPPGYGTITEVPPAPQNAESSQIISLIGRFLSWARTGLITIGLTVGQGITQILLSALLAFFLLRDSSQLAAHLSVAVERLAGDRGRRLIKVAGDTVRSVIYGILGTAIAQAIVAGIGFKIANIPGTVLLSVLTFFFAVIPFGPPLIWLPASLWLFANEKPGLAVFMLLWGFFAISSVDNVLRPFLISQGSKMPFILIFCGVIGGALAFGLVGVFLGPTLLAVAFRLIEEWSSETPTEEPQIQTI